MKRIMSLLMVFVMILSNTSVVSAKSLNQKEHSELVFYDIVTGEEVRVMDKSKTISEKLETWLELADGEYGYITTELGIKGVTSTNNEVIIDFTKEFFNLNFGSLEFSYLLMSLRETIFTNEEINKIELLVEGEQLNQIGEYDFSEGFTKNENRDEAVDAVIMSIPDVPNPVIVIDPGHGGIFPGASYNGVNEKAITLGIALALKTYLENKGATVYLTRSTDTQLSTTLSDDLAARADIANNNNADLFISIHCNAATNTSASGVETWYPGNHDVSTSISLAQQINTKISTRQSLTNRGEKTKSLQVLNETEMIAVLVEVGFMSNSSDFGKMDSASDQQALAYSIYLGTRLYWYGY